MNDKIVEIVIKQGGGIVELINDLWKNWDDLVLSLQITAAIMETTHNKIMADWLQTGWL